VPPSGTRRSVGSRWASVHRPWTAVPLCYKGFTARCGCPWSVHTLAACGEVHGLSTRSPVVESVLIRFSHPLTRCSKRAYPVGPHTHDW
jgi:hypothetical protein